MGGWVGGERGEAVLVVSQWFSVGKEMLVLDPRDVAITFENVSRAKRKGL